LGGECQEFHIMLKSGNLSSVECSVFVVFRYAEYMLVKDVSNVIKVPDSLPLDVAAILPCGALAAYAAVQRIRPFVEDRLLNSSGQSAVAFLVYVVNITVCS